MLINLNAGVLQLLPLLHHIVVDFAFGNPVDVSAIYFNRCTNNKKKSRLFKLCFYLINHARTQRKRKRKKPFANGYKISDINSRCH